MNFTELFALRDAALTPLLGEPETSIMTSLLPIYMGGAADVRTYKLFVKGCAYVTYSLTGWEQQPPNRLGQYELMICTRKEEAWAPDLISKLAKYSLEAVLNWGETMDIGPAMPKGSNIEGLLFAPPPVAQKEGEKYPDRFHVDGKECHLVLCVGLTVTEKRACMAGKTREVFRKLREEGIYPFTDLKRKPVI